MYSNISLLLVLILLSACHPSRPGDTLADVGSESLNKTELSAMAGMPYDSIPDDQKWELVHGWVERSLLRQEAERTGLDKDPVLVMRTDQVKAELYRSRILQSRRMEEPSDSVISAYYTAHSSEFLRPVDTYMVEIYWSEDEDKLTDFKKDYAKGDTSLLENGDVADDGSWLAGADELDSVVAAELSQMKSGQFTKPRPQDEGFRMLLLNESYPAGTQLALSAVQEEIKMRMMIERNRDQSENLINDLRNRFPVSIHMEDKH